MDDLERLERAGWDALCAGTGSDYYGRLMTEDGVMVLAHGAVLDRDAVAASLDEAPPLGPGPPPFSAPSELHAATATNDIAATAPNSRYRFIPLAPLAPRGPDATQA